MAAATAPTVVVRVAAVAVVSVAAVVVVNILRNFSVG